MDVPTFKRWIGQGDTTRPAADSGLGTLVEIAGQDYLARLVVKESANGRLFYDHDLSDVVEVKRPDNSSAVSIPASKAGADRTPSGRTFTIEKIAAAVNREGRAGWVFDSGALESRRRNEKAPPAAGLRPSGPLESRAAAGAATAGVPPMQPGAVKLQDGALDTAGGKGLAEILAGLNGEHDHFMAWIAANRAERLAAEWQVRFENGVTERFANEAAARAAAAKWPGSKAEPTSRERLFTPEDIQVGKRLASGKMADGRDRSVVYRQALDQFNELQRSVLDVAQEAGLVDPSARKLWESEFYVPFYRVMEDDATGTMGPGQIGGLVGQQAYKRLKGGTDKLGDLVANTVSNWSHLLSASMKNLAAQGALTEAEKLGIASRVRQAECGSVRAMFDGKERHYLVTDPLVMNALTALHYVGSNDPFAEVSKERSASR